MCHKPPVTYANNPTSEHRQFQFQALVVENTEIFFHRNQIHTNLNQEVTWKEENKGHLEYAIIFIE